MTGKNCVAIACDTRLGLQQQTVSCDFQKVCAGSGVRRRAAHDSPRRERRPIHAPHLDAAADVTAAAALDAQTWSYPLFPEATLKATISQRSPCPPARSPAWRQIFKMNDKLMLGVTGLATDVLTLQQLLKFKLNMYKLREEREMKPETFSWLLTRYFLPAGERTCECACAYMCA